jgi:hypothetical protein
MDEWEVKIHWLLTALLLLVLYACIMSSLRELRIQQQRTRDAVYTMSARTDSLLTKLEGARIWLWLPSIEEK